MVKPKRFFKEDGKSKPVTPKKVSANVKTGKENDIRSSLLRKKRKSQGRRPVVDSDTATSIHDLLIKMLGGEPGVLNMSNLDYVLSTVEGIGADLKDSEKRIKKQVSYVLYNLVSLHPYVNGNKRSGFLVSNVYANLRGWTIEAPMEESADLVLGVAAGRLTLKDVEKWVETHLTKRQDL